MKRLVPRVVAALAVVLAVGLGLVLGRSPEVAPTANGAAAAQTDDSPPADKGERAPRSEGHGPPPWAGDGRGGPPPWAGHGKGAPSSGWQDAWRRMTPAQRESTMRRLAREHSDGMREWRQCVDGGAQDCEKPLPPGLAKKQLTR